MTQRPARVVHVINEIVPGGAEKQLQEIAARSRLDAEIVELQTAAARSPVQRLVRLRRELTRRRPDVVVAWLDRSQIACAVVARHKWRLVSTVRGPPQRRERQRKGALRLAYVRSDWLVANSRALRDMTREWAAPLPLRRFAVIPNGVEAMRVAGAAPRGDGPLRLGYLGRAHHYKGVDVLLDAFASLPAGSATLRLVGAGVPEVVADHGAGELVEAHGRVAGPWDVLGEVDVLVVPSRRYSEGSPNVVLEAFARGVPVIGTTDPGARELLEPGRGIVVPENDAPALAAAISRFAADPAAVAPQTAAARSYVNETHAWPAVAAAWDDLIERVAGDRSAACVG